MAPAPKGRTTTAAEAPGDYDALVAEAEGLRGRRAEETFRRAIEVNPNGAQALAGLAFLLLNRGQLQEARDLAQRAVTADPTSARGWITLGAAKQSLREEDYMDAYRACVEQGQGPMVRECRLMIR